VENLEMNVNKLDDIATALISSLNSVERRINGRSPHSPDEPLGTAQKAAQDLKQLIDEYRKEKSAILDKAFS
jgi:hypothetical protein